MIRLEKVGTLVHQKGCVGDSGYVFTSWDFIKKCNGRECKIVDYCHYFGDGNNKKLDLCKVERTYVRNQLSVFTPIFEASPDPFIISAIGDHILPMYHDLVKVLIEIAAYEGDLMYTDRSGKRNIVPLYKEKRDIQAHIWKLMRESGVTAFCKQLGYFLPRVSAGDLPGVGKTKVLKRQKPGFGDGGYVDEMYGG